MKDSIIHKLTLIIESTDYKSISNDVINSIYALEKSITSNQELKLYFAFNEDEKEEVLKTKNLDFVSPENWDYWPV